jgi:hypothetical protein
VHRLSDWSIVHLVARERGGGVITGIFRDGATVVGLATARLHGLGRRRALLGIADVECVGAGALPGFVLADGLPGTLHPDGQPSPALLAAALRAFEFALRREFGHRVPAVAYRQVYARELPVMLGGATVVREGMPVTVLRNRFDSYDGYLRSLRTSRRTDQRRLVRRIDADPEVTVHFGTPGDVALDVATFQRLSYEAAHRNHTHRWPALRTWSPELFAALIALPDTNVFTYTDPAGRLIAASATFDHRVAPLAGPWGALPLAERRSGLWFDHMARLIRWAVDGGRPLLLSGKGIAHAKQALGFAVEQQWTVLRRL